MTDTHDSSESKGGFGSFLKISLGIAFFAFVTGSILCAYRLENKTYDQTRAIERTKKLNELRTKEAAILDSYAVLDEAKGIYQIPIARSMELEIEALKDKPLRTVGVIPVK